MQFSIQTASVVNDFPTDKICNLINFIEINNQGNINSNKWTAIVCEMIMVECIDFKMKAMI